MTSALTVQKSTPTITGVLMSDHFQGIYSGKQVVWGKSEFFFSPSGLYCFGPVMLFVPLLHLCLLGLGKVLFVDYISPRFTFSHSRMHNFIGCFPDFPYISQVSTVLLYMCVFLETSCLISFEWWVGGVAKTCQKLYIICALSARIKVGYDKLGNT